MLHTFIFIVGIAALLLLAKALTRLAGIDKHLDDLIDKSVSLTLEVRQLHTDLNRNSAQAVASMASATISVENTKALLQECKEAVVPLMETQTRTLDDIQDRFAEYETIVKAAAEADGAHEGDEGTLLVEHPEPEPATATGHASMGPIVEDNPDE